MQRKHRPLIDERPVHELKAPHEPAELVNKIGTSATQRKKRKRIAAKKMKEIGKAMRRMGKTKWLYAVCLTLTYAESDEFEKKHITRFNDCLRAKLKRQGHSLGYIWVLERASVLHYHLVLWLPRGYRLEHDDLARWWPHGSTSIEACRKVTAWLKYMRKSESKDNLPESARMFGYGGLDEEGKEAVKRATLPRWLKERLSCDAQPFRVKGGWVDRSTGEFFETPWLWTPRGMRLKSSFQCADTP